MFHSLQVKSPFSAASVTCASFRNTCSSDMRRFTRVSESFQAPLCNFFTGCWNNIRIVRWRDKMSTPLSSTEVQLVRDTQGAGPISRRYWLLRHKLNTATLRSPPSCPHCPHYKLCLGIMGSNSLLSVSTVALNDMVKWNHIAVILTDVASAIWFIISGSYFFCVTIFIFIVFDTPPAATENKTVVLLDQDRAISLKRQRLTERMNDVFQCGEQFSIQQNAGNALPSSERIFVTSVSGGTWRLLLKPRELYFFWIHFGFRSAAKLETFCSWHCVTRSDIV